MIFTVNKLKWKLKGQYRMDNPKKPATSASQDKDEDKYKQKQTQHNTES